MPGWRISTRCWSRLRELRGRRARIAEATALFEIFPICWRLRLFDLLCGLPGIACQAWAGNCLWFQASCLGLVRSRASKGSSWISSRKCSCGLRCESHSACGARSVGDSMRSTRLGLTMCVRTQAGAMKIDFRGPAAKAASMSCVDFSRLKAAAPSRSRAEMSSHADSKVRVAD